MKHIGRINKSLLFYKHKNCDDLKYVVDMIESPHKLFSAEE